MSVITTTTRVIIENGVLDEMRNFGEGGYPEEVVGLLLGTATAKRTVLHHFLKAENHFDADARCHRFRVNPHDWLRSEGEAKRLAIDIVGVFHTHPNCPSKPSAYDLEFALPNFVYLIAAIGQNGLVDIRAWKLLEELNQFEECLLQKPFPKISARSLRAFARIGRRIKCRLVARKVQVSHDR